jgi:hypothetical protein
MNDELYIDLIKHSNQIFKTLILINNEKVQ